MLCNFETGNELVMQKTTRCTGNQSLSWYDIEFTNSPAVLSWMYHELRDIEIIIKIEKCYGIEQKSYVTRPFSRQPIAPTYCDNVPLPVDHMNQWERKTKNISLNWENGQFCSWYNAFICIFKIFTKIIRIQ